MRIVFGALDFAEYERDALQHAPEHGTDGEADRHFRKCKEGKIIPDDLFAFIVEVDGSLIQVLAYPKSRGEAWTDYLLEGGELAMGFRLPDRGPMMARGPCVRSSGSCPEGGRAGGGVGCGVHGGEL